VLELGGSESLGVASDLGADRIVAVNLTGTFSCVQAALPNMFAAGRAPLSGRSTPSLD
jgi:hypothetical protein